MQKRQVGLLAAGLMVVALTAAATHITRFSVSLTGDEEVPPVETDAEGKFTARANMQDDQIDFRLRLNDMENVTMAHLHCAPPGSNGPVVVTLFGMIPGGFDVDGELADYTITQDNIEATAASCAPAIATLDDLMNAMQAGMIYANVHTTAHPGGEVRAQVGTFVPSVTPTPTPTPTATPTPTVTPTP